VSERSFASIAREEVLAQTFERMASGESLAAIYRTPGFPTLRAFWKWLHNDPELQARYNAALTARSLHDAEELRALADEKPPMVETQFGAHMDAAFVAWKKLQVDTRKWELSKRHPKIYGDKLTHSNDPDNPIPPLVVIGPKSDDAAESTG
jgi:hypothetical protein